MKTIELTKTSLTKKPGTKNGWITEKYNFNSAKGVETFPATSGNAITKDYYWSLVGQINDGMAKKAVCRIETLPFGVFSYHLISQR